MKLELHNGARSLGTLDLGEPDQGYFDQGALAPTEGNLYLYLDGKEYASLFFTADENGNPRIHLGQFDHSLGEWVIRNPITVSVPETRLEDS